ncbi:MAG TPA: hypothetical protein VF815_20235 [Myxococcaceae bacterium]
MSSRTPLLAFLVGGLFILSGIFTLVVYYPRTRTSLESWEDRQRLESIKEWARDDSSYDERYERPREAEADPMVVLFMGGSSLLVGLGLTLPQLFKWVGESAFKEAVLEVPPEGAALGGEAVVRVRLVPGGALRVASAELRLISEELAHYFEEQNFGGGNDEERKRTKVMEIHRWSQRLAIPQDLNAPFELEVSIPIHREVPPSFRWERHMARTRLELEVELVGRVNLHLEKNLLVVPRLASAEVSA